MFVTLMTNREEEWSALKRQPGSLLVLLSTRATKRHVVARNNRRWRSSSIISVETS